MANMQSMNRTEALRLADALSQGRYLTTDAGNPIAEAAAELRRLHARIAELEAKASENYWLLYAMKEQELWYQDELVEEAKRTAAEKLRADQMTEQHRMQSAMNTEARGELAQLREKRQPLSDEQIDALPIVIRLRERIKYWKRESAKQYVEGWNDSAEQEGARSAPAAPVEMPEPIAQISMASTGHIEWRHGLRVREVTPLDGQALYTEQQVRELLSQAGTVLPETPESPPKSAETRMDASSDRGGGVLPEPAIDLPRAGAEALKEYFQFCKEQSILPDVGGAFAYAIRAGAKIAAAPKLPQGDGWLPIESAPKDKTILLGYRNTHGNWRTLRGEWFSREEIDEFWEDPDGVEPGWFETSVEADDVPNVWRTEPTHWMPLPQPPKEQG